MASIWDDKEMFPSGDFVKFETIGDTVTGRITALRRHMFDDGKVVPQLELDTPEGPKTLTAGQIRLKAELAEKRPNVGDRITITLQSIEKRPGGKTMKQFHVAVEPAPQAGGTIADQLKADRARLAAARTPLPDDAPF